MKKHLLLSLALTLCAGASAQGDDCSTATPVNGAGVWAFDTTTSTASTFSGSSACSGAGSLDLGSDQFFQWTADQAGSWQIDLCGSGYDTKLNLHVGTGCAATCAAYNDDFCGLQSGAVLNGLNVGDTYLIQVGGWNGATGTGTVTTTFLGGGGVSNDDCSSPDMISGLGSWNYSTVTATASGFAGSSACASGSLDMGPDLFFEWTAATAGDYEFTTELSTYDTKLSVHAGAGCAATCVGYNDDFYGLQSRVLVQGVNAGDVLLVQCGGWGGSTGAGQLDVRQYVDVCTTYTDDTLEDNDTTSTAVALAPGSWAGLVTFDATAGVGDSDFYSITLQPGEYFDLTVVNINAANEDVDFTEYDSAGNFVQDWDTNAVSLINTSAAATTHIIEARPDFTFGERCAQYDMDLTITLDPCATLTADVFETNDTTATATSIVSGNYPALNVTDSVDLDLFTFVVADGATFTAEALHNSSGCGNADIDMFLYDPSLSPVNEDPTVDPINGGELANAYTCADAELLTWTNTTGADVTCVLRVSVWPVGAVPGCSFYDLTLTGADADGPDLYCSPAATNSTGNSVTLANSDFSGSGVFHLEATGGPNNQFGMFVVSATAVDPGIPVSSGFLCVGAPIGRYNSTAGPGLNSVGRFDAAGVLQNLFGTSTSGTGFDVPAVLPNPPGGVITTGSTWHFQLWYRDIGSVSNFSDAITVTF